VSSEPPITRSREGKCDNLGTGPELMRVLALSVAPPPPLGQGSNAAIWLIVCDVGQQAERDVRALSRAASAFIAERTRRLSTLLWMMCPHDIYCVLSIPLAGGARATLQTAQLSSPLSKQCACVARCTVLIPYTRSFPLRNEATQISGVRAHGDYTGVASSKSILQFVPGPTCRGSEPLYMPP
jgi:hypothetical protein